MKPLYVVLFAAAVMAPTSEARADGPCRALLAPTGGSVRDTGLDQNRSACATDGFVVGTRALATIDAKNFYGTLSSSLMLDYRMLHLSGFEFSLGARLVDYRFAQSAVFTDGELSAGPISVGVLRPTRSTWWGIPVAVAHAIRFEVPYTNLADQDLSVAASPSALATLTPSPRLHLHGRMAALLWSVLPESGADSRAALLASTDVAYAPVSAFSLNAGLEAQAGWYGLGLDHLQARGGVRLKIGDGAIEISAATTLVGEERNDLVMWLGYRRLTTTKRKKAPPKRRSLKDWAKGI